MIAAAPPTAAASRSVGDQLACMNGERSPPLRREPPCRPGTLPGRHAPRARCRRLSPSSASSAASRRRRLRGCRDHARRRSPHGATCGLRARAGSRRARGGNGPRAGIEVVHGRRADTGPNQHPDSIAHDSFSRRPARPSNLGGRKIPLPPSRVGREDSCQSARRKRTASVWYPRAPRGRCRSRWLALARTNDHEE
jgi:hypothetical protein